MNRIALFFLGLVCLFVSAPALAQPSEGVRVGMPDHLSFQLADGFELDDRGTGPLQVMLVPTGTGDSQQDIRELPEASVLMVADVGQPGAYAELGTDLTMSLEELEQLNATLEAGFVGEAESRGDMTDVEWTGTQIVQLGGTQAIRFRFTGRIGTGKLMITNVYMIQNNDTM